MFAQIAHAVIDKKIYSGSVCSLQPFKEKATVACDPPYACRPAIQTTEARAHNKKREVELRYDKPRDLFAFRRHTCMHFRLFAAIEKGLLQRFWKERQGHSQRLWALEAFFYSKAPIWNACESWARLTSFSPAHVQWTASRSGKERVKDRFRSTETNIAFGPPKPKTKSCRRARQLFFSQSLFLIAFLVLGGGREGRPFVVCEGQAQTHRHEKRPWFQFVYVWCWEVVIENLVFLNGKFNTCWKVWVLMLAAGSEVLMTNYHPAELWSTPVSPTSGVERRFMTLQVCQISMDDVTELGEFTGYARFHGNSIIFWTKSGWIQSERVLRFYPLA